MERKILNNRNTIHVLVIGGVNADIWGSPSGSFRLHDSNPGTVRLKPGGVGRNIAHNLRLLGAEAGMLTAFGDDYFSDFLREKLTELGIDWSLSVSANGTGSSVYLYITDGSGDMHVAISDMDVVSLITPEVLKERLSAINSFDAVVLDANLSEETLTFAAENITVPIYADAVSTAKAVRLKAILPSLRAIKPNMLEAEILSGEYDAAAAAEALVRSGVKCAFVSDGAAGITASDGIRTVHIRPQAVQVVNATGAGDAATAAMIYADMLGLPIEEAALLAVKAGAVTVCSEETNAPNLASILD